jgi:hypothetical protein
MIAGSEGTKSREMCLDAGAGYVEMPNVPLSAKFNKAAMMAMISYKPDYLLILGSDDFLNDALIQKYLTLDCDVVGITDCYFYQRESKEAGFWKGYPEGKGKYNRKGETIGMARMISRKVWELAHGRLWPSNMNSGLDFNMMVKIKRMRRIEQFAMSLVGSDMVAVDVKDKDSITEFGCYRYNMDMVDANVFDSIPEFKDIL